MLDDGTQVILTHNIVNVKTKDGIARWGEVQVPDNAEILALRTHKADGRVREPEEIVGKETISAPDLAAGDFVEWETVEYREPGAAASAPGFVGDRFFFQSLELPLHLSEYLLLAPEALTARLRSARRSARARGERPGLSRARGCYRFVAREMPQLFGEPAAVLAPRVDPLGARLERRDDRALGPDAGRRAVRRGPQLAGAARRWPARWPRQVDRRQTRLGRGDRALGTGATSRPR